MSAAVAKAESEGLVVVASAGDDGKDGCTCPAGYPTGERPHIELAHAECRRVNAKMIARSAVHDQNTKMS